MSLDIPDQSGKGQWWWCRGGVVETAEDFYRRIPDFPADWKKALWDLSPEFDAFEHLMLSKGWCFGEVPQQLTPKAKDRLTSLLVLTNGAGKNIYPHYRVGEKPDKENTPRVHVNADGEWITIWTPDGEAVLNTAAEAIEIAEALLMAARILKGGE